MTGSSECTEIRMSPAPSRSSMRLLISRGNPSGCTAPLPPASPPTTPPATAPPSAETSGPAAIKAPTPGRASAETPANHPKIPPTSPPVSAPRIASSFIEIFFVSERWAGRMTDISEGEKLKLRRCVRILFACGSLEARQYTVLSTRPSLLLYLGRVPTFRSIVRLRLHILQAIRQTLPGNRDCRKNNPSPERSYGPLRFFHRLPCHRLDR